MPGITQGLDLLFDIKTIHGGTDPYMSALGHEAQGEAVTQRARQVDATYARIAWRLDGDRASAVTAALRRYPAVRALVFGQYGEGSADVHDLLQAERGRRRRIGGRGWGRGRRRRR